jgi:hypothetical protein
MKNAIIGATILIGFLSALCIRAAPSRSEFAGDLRAAAAQISLDLPSAAPPTAPASAVIESQPGQSAWIARAKPIAQRGSALVDRINSASIGGCSD